MTLCGRSKSQLSSKRFGFTGTEWEKAAWALREHAAEHDVTRVETSLYGQRYVIEGTIRSPDGRAPFIRTIWFIETGEETPRFVTAYPVRRNADD
jgi:hypothetical protein